MTTCLKQFCLRHSWSAVCYVFVVKVLRKQRFMCIRIGWRNFAEMLKTDEHCKRLTDTADILRRRHVIHWERFYTYNISWRRRNRMPSGWLFNKSHYTREWNMAVDPLKLNMGTARELFHSLLSPPPSTLLKTRADQPETTNTWAVLSHLTTRLKETSRLGGQYNTIQYNTFPG